MCRMLGVVSALPRAFALLLEQAPHNMALLSEKHPDGWGIAWGRGHGAWTVHKSLLRATDDPEFHEFATSVTGDVIVAHVRQKTQGDLGNRNTHPFEAAPWIFAHNGTVQNLEYLEARLSPERRANIRGDTDSERLFAFLLSRLDSVTSNRHDRYTVDRVLRAVTHELDGVPYLGTASFLLADGDVLYAHRWGAPLFLLQRTAGSQLNCSECARNPCIAVTTEPITDENWIPLGDGDLVRIVRGPAPSWTRIE
jgi:predicted glutamine amidotransferase